MCLNQTEAIAECAVERSTVYVEVFRVFLLL